MKSKDMIYGSISFIEHQLSDELNIDELAKQTFFSRTHYKRLFQIVMGESVMEYIKKRRLQRAGMALCETDLSVLEIALKYGYVSHEGFSRAFKTHFGVPPLEYRKRYSKAKLNLYHKESVNMITNETKKIITKHISEITKELEGFVSNLEKWTKPAQQEIDKAGRTAGGMKVAFREWVTLTERIDSIKNDIQKIPTEAETAYDLYDESDKLVKIFDNILFHMNLLRFLTGVEWSRMGDHGVPFEPIVRGLDALFESESRRNDATLKLVLEARTQIQEEIKHEAKSLLVQSADFLREVVNEGTLLSEKINALVLKLGVQGRGFALIARETEKAVSLVRNAEILMTRQASDDDFDIESQTHAMTKIQDSAFQMNLIGFNAAVESARSGDEEDCAKRAEEVRAYAAQMFHTTTKCKELNNEYMRLVELLCTKDMNADSHSLWKKYSDIVFQVNFLNTQLYLESERSSRDNFITLSRDFVKVSEALVHEQQHDDKTDVLDSFAKSISVLIERGKAEAKAAGNCGVGIAYILDEYSRLILLISL